MSGPNFNITDRKALSGGDNIIDIYEAADWGTAITAPDGVSRVPLIASTSYLIHADHFPPRFLMPDVSGGGGTIDFLFVNNAVSLLFASGPDLTPHFWGRNVGSLYMATGNLVDVSNGAPPIGEVVLFDLQGNSVTTRISFQTMFVGFFKSLGTFVDIFHDHFDSLFGFNGKGFVCRNTSAIASEHTITSNAFRSVAFFGAMIRPAFSFLGSPASINLNLGRVALTAGEDFLYLDENLTAGTNILFNTYNGPSDGNFLQTEKIITITSQSNADIAISSFETRDSGAKTAMVFAAIQDFVVGQTILIADEAAYDGLQVITSVDTDQKKFVFDVAFSTSGAGTLKMVQHSVGSGNNVFVRDATIAISDTTAYETTGLQILREDDNSFHLPQAFVTDELAGNAITSPLDERTPKIILLGNGAQKGSQQIALAAVNANATTTAITDGTYVALNVNGMIANIVTERFELTDTNLGIFTWRGITVFEGFVSGFMGIDKGSANAEAYRFSMSLNGAAPLFSAIGLTEITSVALGSNGRASFVHAGTSPPIGSFATMVNFADNIFYNKTGLVIVSGATSFEVDDILFGTNEFNGDFSAAAANFVPLPISSDKVVISFLFSANLRTDDTIQLMVAGDGSTETITADDLTLGVF